MNCKKNEMFRVALFCADQALNGVPNKVKEGKKDKIPITRLRWYAVAESLYGESLFNLVDESKQEKDSQDKILLTSVAHFVSGCDIATKSGLSYVLIEMCKLMWNTLLPLLDSKHNRNKLIDPMTKVHQNLMELKESSDPDYLVLYYSALFSCISEQKEWNLGEKIVDEAFTYVPSTHQKVLWESKMLYLSKLGKNVLNAIANMKEGNASLQAMVWVKLA